MQHQPLVSALTSCLTRARGFDPEAARRTAADIVRRAAPRNREEARELDRALQVGGTADLLAEALLTAWSAGVDLLSFLGTPDAEPRTAADDAEIAHMLALSRRLVDGAD